MVACRATGESDTITPSGAHGQDHAAHVRRAHAASERGCQPDDRRHHGRGLVGQRRSPERPRKSGYLLSAPTRAGSSGADPRPARHGGDRPLLRGPRPRRDRAHQIRRQGSSFPRPPHSGGSRWPRSLQARPRQPAPDGAAGASSGKPVAGVLLTMLERALPKHKKYLPSPTGVGLGLVLAFYYPLQMLLGAIAAAIASRTRGSRSAEMGVRAASGAHRGREHHRRRRGGAQQLRAEVIVRARCLFVRALAPWGMSDSPQDAFWDVGFALDPPSPVRLVSAASGLVVAAGAALHMLRPGSRRLRSARISRPTRSSTSPRSRGLPTAWRSPPLRRHLYRPPAVRAGVNPRSTAPSTAAAHLAWARRDGVTYPTSASATAESCRSTWTTGRQALTLPRHARRAAIADDAKAVYRR